MDLNGKVKYNFSSIAEATKTLHISNISSVLSKNTKTAGGYIWLYKEEFISMSEEDINNLLIYSKDRSLIGGIETQFKKGQIP